MRAAISLLVLAAACSRPDTLVVCHNGNCKEPVDPENDDSIEAFRESLTLEQDGRPLFDGIEIDTFWRGSDDTCIYAHDLANAEQLPAIEPANELAAFFARPGPIGFSDQPFLVSMELKSFVSEDTTQVHTPEQRAMHAACEWQLYKVIADAAVANNRDVKIVFQAFAGNLLEAMIAATPADTPVPFGYAGIQGVPAPLDDQTRSLADYRHVPIELVELHAQWITDAQYEAIESAGQDVAFFMFSLTNESFAAIEQFEPVYVTTSEATLFRRWLER